MNDEMNKYEQSEIVLNNDGRRIAGFYSGSYAQ